MPTIEYSIQIEDHAWDAAPSRRDDRMTNQTMQQITGRAPGPVPGSTPNRRMFFPLDTLRWVSRSSGARSPRAAPMSSETSASISC